MGTFGFERAADRIVRKDYLWFVKCREGSRGPYLSRQDAETQLSRHIDKMERLEARRASDAN